MSQEKENEAFDNETADELSVNSAAEDNNTVSTWNIFLLALLLALVCICTVLLVLVVNLGREADGISERLAALEEAVYQDSAQDHSLADGEAEASDEAKAEAAAAELENQTVWDGGTAADSGIRRVYLTFDDGPSPNTDKILDILDEYGVKATFFVVGKEGYAEQYQRIVDEGHTLAMHSYSHVYSEIYSSLEAYSADLMKLKTMLYEITGVECSIVRFPGGSSNTISSVDMRTLIEYLDSEGMIYFDWNVSSGDASSAYISAAQIASNVLDNIGQYNNAVVLMHDAAGKASTVEALPTIIETLLESEDTVILPISDETVRIQHIH